MLPRPTGGAPPVIRRRCWVSRSRSKTTSTSPECQPPSALRGRSARHPGRRSGAPAEGGRRGDRRQDQHLRTGPMAVHQRTRVRPHPQSVVASGTLRAGRRAVARPRSPPAWSPPRSAPTARAVSGSRPPGRIWWASNRNVAASRRWPLPEAFNGITVNGVLARTVADAALVLDAASGNVEGDLHKPRPVTVTDHVGIAPGPLRIALSTRFPFTGFPARLHPEIRAARESVGDQLRAARPQRGVGQPRLRTAAVVELSVPFHFWTARLGRPVG